MKRSDVLEIIEDLWKFHELKEEFDPERQPTEDDFIVGLAVGLASVRNKVLELPADEQTGDGSQWFENGQHHSQE